MGTTFSKFYSNFKTISFTNSRSICSQYDKIFIPGHFCIVEYLQNTYCTSAANKDSDSDSDSSGRVCDMQNCCTRVD